MSHVNFRRSYFAALAAGLWLADANAWAQSTLPLKPAVDEEQANPQLVTAETEDVPPLPQQPEEEDSYAPPGIKLGGLTFFPSLNTSAVYSTNANQSSDSPKGGMGLRLRPALRFESDWARHSWTGTMSGDFTRYFESDAQDLKGIDAEQRFRLDIRRTTRVEITGAYVLDQTDLGDSELPATATGDRTDQTLAGMAALIHDFGGFEGRLRAGASRNVYGSVDLSGGGVEDNSDRDYTEPLVSIRLGYTDPPAIKPYAELGYAPRFHDESVDRNGLERDSDGLIAALGAVIDAGPIWTGDLALTYQYRNYDDPTLSDQNMFGAVGFLTWAPTELTSFTLTLGAALDESSSVTDAATPTWTAELDATHALRENLSLLSYASIEIEDTEGSGTDITYEAGISTAWMFNPYLAWTLGYDFTWLDGADGGSSWTESRFSTGLTVSH